MAVNKNNKLLGIVISKEDYAKIETLAKKECRSVSKQALLYLLKGLQLSEEKRDD